MGDRRGVIFHGFYGQRNGGDDAFARVASMLADQHRVERCMFTAWPRAFAELGIRGKAVYPEAARIPGELRARVVASSISAGTSVLFGGSTLFQRQRALDDQLLLVKADRVRLHACGISVGPFETTEDESAVARYLKAFDSISVRDPASYDRVARLAPDSKLTQGLDLALLLPRRTRRADRIRTGEGARPVLGISVCTSASRGGDTAADKARLAATLRLVNQAVRQTGASVRLIVMNGHERHGDTTLTSLFGQQLDSSTDCEIVPYSPNTTTLIDALAGCTAVIAMRLHAAIFAFSSRVPVLLAAYHTKSKDFAEAVGYPTRVLMTTETDTTGDRDLQTLLAMLEGRDRASYSPRLDVEAASQMAEIGVGTVRRVMDTPVATKPSTPRQLGG